MDLGRLNGKMMMSETNQCEYAETALEHYMKKCFHLEEENKELKKQIDKLLKIMEGRENA